VTNAIVAGRVTHTHTWIIHDTVTILMPMIKLFSLEGDRRRWAALVAVLLAQLMIVLDATIVNVALPSIQDDLHFSQSSLTWVVNAYLITFGSFLLVAGRLGDLVGRRRVLLAGLAVFTVASALCGLAQDSTMLVAARFVQGLGGALASAVVLAILATEFPEPVERAKAISSFTFVSVAGGSVGLLAGGALTQAIDWHWIFFVNLPIGALTAAAIVALVQERPGIGLGKGVDVLGAVMVTVAMALTVLAIVEAPDHGWASVQTLGFGGAGIALLAAFVALEMRLSNPILPLGLLRLRSLAGSSVVRATLGMGMYGAFFLGALYLEHIRGYGAVRTGAAFLPWTLVVGVLSVGPTAGLVRRFGAGRPLLAGLVIMIAGLLLLSRAGAGDAYFPTVFVPFLLMGLGAGMAFAPLLQIAMADVPAADAGIASALVNVSLYISGALGLAALGALATDHTRSLAAHGSTAADALAAGYHLAFVVAAVCLAVGAVVALVVLRAGSPAGVPAPAAAPARS
jgi:EmrB/QacA subfamily drug resistance transporter